MTKRFTETDKWKDAWFSALSPEAKLLFEFLRDNCDIAGFWEINLPLAAFHTRIPEAKVMEGNLNGMGDRRTIEGAFEELKSRLVVHDGWAWIVNFLFHQGNLPLNEKNKWHVGILRSINSHNDMRDMVLEAIERQCKKKGVRRGIEGASMGLQSPTGNRTGNSNMSMSGNKEIGVKGEDTPPLPPKGKRGRSSSPPEYSFEFGAFWDDYPRKEAKLSAWKCWNARLKEGIEDYILMSCAKNYAEAMRNAGRPSDKMMLGATFLGANRRWEDFTNGNYAHQQSVRLQEAGIPPEYRLNEETNELERV